MSDSPTIPDDDLGFDVISYAREIVSDPSHHDADEFMPATIEEDARLTAFDVSAWAGQHLIVTEDHLSLDAGTANFAALSIGDTFVACGANVTGKAGYFLEVAAVTGYNIYFTLEAKTKLNGVDAADFLVHVASAAYVVA